MKTKDSLVRSFRFGDCRQGSCAAHERARIFAKAKKPSSESDKGFFYGMDET